MKNRLGKLLFSFAEVQANMRGLAESLSYIKFFPMATLPTMGGIVQVGCSPLFDEQPEPVSPSKAPIYEIHVKDKMDDKGIQTGQEITVKRVS